MTARASPAITRLSTSQAYRRRVQPVTPVVALTIAGSDSGGGAGIQADLKTFAAHRVYGTSAVTAVTAQHTAAVTAVVALDPDLVVAQIDAVTTDLRPAATKTGMLANPAIVAAVAGLAADGAAGEPRRRPRPRLDERPRADGRRRHRRLPRAPAPPGRSVDAQPPRGRGAYRAAARPT